MRMRNSSNSRGDPEVKTLLHMTPSYLDPSTNFCPFYSPRVSKQQQCKWNKGKTTGSPGFIVILQVSWGMGGQGSSQCHLYKAENTAWVQVKDWAFITGQRWRTAQGLEFRNIHVCHCCYVTRIKVANRHHQRQVSSTGQAQESHRKGRVEDGNGSIQCARTTCLTLHRLMCNIYVDS